MRPLAILRPEPSASSTASAAEALGLTPIVMPLFRIEPVAWRAPAPAGFDGLLLTSANAVRHGGRGLDQLRGLAAYCVGEATASEARNAGFTVAGVGLSGVDSLLETLPDGLRLLHLCGADRRDPADPRQSVEPVRVYRAVELPVPLNLDQLEGAVAAAYSPRTAARLSSLVDQAGLRRERIAVAVMSDTAAKAAGPGWERVESASDPSESALLALAVELCDNRR
ncbi:MAG TPA: uroporphyrinogen-III synthase [Sphingomicrobium sp.]|nr:uroporphyrinogen-III synthase [Sphingomicrobium sp.]